MMSATAERSFSPATFVLTLSHAPRTAARAARAPTPASEAEAGLPCSAIAWMTGNASSAAFIVRNGTSIALRVAAWTAAFRAAAAGPLKGILAVEDAPLVSIDFRQNANSSIVDSQFTKVVDGNLIKVLSWYDNEWGYSCRVRDLIKYIADKGL